MEKPRVLRPLGTIELWNESFDLYKRNFLLFAGLSAIGSVPLSAIVECIPPESSAYYPSVPVVVLISTILEGPGVLAAARRYLGREVSIAGAWRAFRGEWTRYSLTMALALLISLLGLVALVIPGVIFVFWITFVSTVAIQERRYFGDAIRRSRELAAGRWGRVFAIVLGTIALIAIQEFVAYSLLPVGAASGTEGTSVLALSWERLALGALRGVGDALVAPIGSIAFVLLYFDIRVRKEGFDIELLAEEAAPRATA